MRHDCFGAADDSPRSEHAPEVVYKFIKGWTPAWIERGIQGKADPPSAHEKARAKMTIKQRELYDAIPVYPGHIKCTSLAERFKRTDKAIMMMIGDINKRCGKNTIKRKGTGGYYRPE